LLITLGWIGFWLGIVTFVVHPHVILDTTPRNITKTNKSKKKQNDISYHKKPDNLSLDEWQIGLRRQFAARQEFKITNIGREAVFSDYSVYNPLTGNSYKVAIRSNPEEIASGENFNFCTCYDFKTNGLGTCKHVEAVIGQIRKKKS
jgi:hypothetical protein